MIAIVPRAPGGLATKMEDVFDCRPLPASEAELLDWLRAVRPPVDPAGGKPLCLVEDAGPLRFEEAEFYGFIRGAALALGYQVQPVRPMEWQAGSVAAEQCELRFHRSDPDLTSEVHHPVKGEWAGFRYFCRFKQKDNSIGSKLTISLTVATFLVTKPFIHMGLNKHAKEKVKFWMLYQALTKDDSGAGKVFDVGLVKFMTRLSNPFFGRLRSGLVWGAFCAPCRRMG